GIVIHKPNTEISYANPSALQMLGLTEEEAKGRIADEKDWHFLDSEGNRLTPDLYPVNRVLVSGKPIDNLELGIFDAHRSQPTWVKVAGFPEFNARNELEQIVISFIDISHQRNDISYDQIMSLANDIVVVTNAAPLESPGPDIVSVNHAFSELMGYEPEQVNGKPLSFLKLARLSERTLNEIKARLTNGESYRGRLYAFSKRDQQFWLDINVFPLHNWENRISHFVAIAHDITDIVNREEQLINDALHDPLTGLCNRRGLQARIRQYLKDGNNTANYSLIALDVDRFKQINDHWGHHAGDRVLVEVARIMEDTVRDIDCVARVGGEEFVILLPTMKLETAGQVAERIRERIQNHRIKMNVRDFIMVTASLGVAERAPEDDCIEDTLRKADSALYRAKKSGRNLVESDGSHF
ncbi:MAG: diguanylate cyclase, partial [Ketobacteraceae bacterium]|nr:diguanylate cyclase [Ketobacteraceae bacterium]